MAEADEGRGPAWFGPSAGAAIAAADPALREELRDYLKHQSELAQVQIEEAKREDAIRHWGLRIRHVSDVLKLGFELAVAFIVLAIAAGLGTVIWQAAHADGLVIDTINVPAAMAAKGLSGPVVANKLLDRLTLMQSETDSSRAASTFTNDWTNDITVQIPDTGVSLGQIVRFLDNWLGHQTHLSGDLYETPSGAALTVRIGGAPGQTFDDKNGDLDAIVVKAAEAVYAQAQPYRYSVYLSGKDRFAEALVVLTQLAQSGTREDRAWADVGLAIIASRRGDLAGADAFVRAGMAANPNLPNFPEVTSGNESVRGRDEPQWRANRAAIALIKGGGVKEWDPQNLSANLRAVTSYLDAVQGDYRAALADAVVAAGNGGEEAATTTAASDAIAMHDVAAGRSYLAVLEGDRADPSAQNTAATDAAAQHVLVAAEVQDWPGVVAAGTETMAALARTRALTKGWIDLTIGSRNLVMPWVAYADARLGRFAAADAILKTLPSDCDLCLRLQGKVDALRGHWRAAEAAFRAVAARSPDIPFAHTDWGEMLLHKGDLDGAIAHFEKAHAIGPKFADPLEMWGEALIAKNRSDLALAKFSEAAQDAPNWGRLHLKWGEALLWSGDRAGAQAQFTIAAGLDLTPSERPTLLRLKGSHV